MAGKDNTLGAPTEGLGQTVTFAADGAAVPQTTAMQRQSLKLNAGGGGAALTARALHVPPAQPSSTMQALSKLGDAIIRPALEQERNQAFVDGMQKAAEGQAIGEIVDEQPWFTKLFGSTSLVDGARAYTASSKAASLATEMETSMEELRKMTGPEFSKYTSQQMSKHKTGDSTTDLMIAQQLGNVLPSVMKGQAKAHMRYQQELVESGIGDTITAAAALLGTVDTQARQPGSTKESADTLEAALPFLSALTPPATVNPKLFDGIVTERVRRAVGDGNFAVYHVLEDSGKLNAMDERHQQAIRSAYTQASNRARTALPAELLIQRADFAVMATDGSSDEAILAKAASINKQYETLTGDKTPLISGATTMQELTQRRLADQQEQARQAREIERETDANKKAALYQGQIGALAAQVGSDPNYYVGGSHITDKMRADIWNEVRLAKQDPSLPPGAVSPNFAAVLVTQAGQRNLDPVERDAVPAAAEAAVQHGDRVGLYRAYMDKYVPLVKAGGDLGEVVAQQYAGRAGDLLARYHKLAQGRPLKAEEIAVFYEEATRPVPKPVANDKQKKEIAAVVNTGSVMRAISSIGFTDIVPVENPEKLADFLAPRLDLHLDTETAVGKAMRTSPDLSVLGGKYWTLSTKDTRLDKWVAENPTVKGVDVTNINKASRYSFDKYAAEAGITSSFQVGQTFDADVGGKKVPQFYVLGTGDRGDDVKIKMFTAADINANWVARSESSKVPYAFGDKPITADPKAPSIYASQAEWAAYRKSQAANQ